MGRPRTKMRRADGQVNIGCRVPVEIAEALMERARRSQTGASTIMRQALVFFLGMSPTNVGFRSRRK